MNDYDEKFPGLVPVKNCESETIDGIVELTIKKNYSKIITKTPLKWFFFDTFKMKLDEKGSFIWDLCDGKRTMEKIVREAEEHFAAENDKMSERVKLFVNQLSRRKVLILYEKTGAAEA